MTEPWEARFWAKVDQSGDCWVWTARREHGYGQFWLVRTRYAHRVAYELLVGPIPEGLTLDHLCRNRACVRPDHLEPVSNRENLLRSPLSWASVNAAKTHCPSGHEYVQRTGRRRCLECQRIAWIERRRRRKVA